MPGSHARELVDRWLQSDGRDGAVLELWCALTSVPGFERSRPDYGLPAFAFAYVEVASWLGASLQSGAWTYYEAASTERQLALIGALAEVGSRAVRNAYREGADRGAVEDAHDDLDQWVDANRKRLDRWLLALLRRHRSGLDELL